METRGSEPLDFLLIFELSIILVPIIIVSHFCIEMQGRAWNTFFFLQTNLFLVMSGRTICIGKEYFPLHTCGQPWYKLHSYTYIYINKIGFGPPYKGRRWHSSLEYSVWIYQVCLGIQSVSQFYFSKSGLSKVGCTVSWVHDAFFSVGKLPILQGTCLICSISR